MSDALIAALASGLGTGVLSLIGNLCAVYASQKRTTALILYRIEELEKKVEKHNQLIDRTYALEARTEVQEAEIRETMKRVDAIEKV